MLRTICAQIKTWHLAGYIPLRGAVNFSVRQFREENLPVLIGNILKEIGLTPEALELEVTESIAMQSGDLSLVTLNKLNSIGLRISIDDFGTGYSSLDRLKRMPVQTLKIDQTFVKDMTAGADERAIIMAIIAMARSLNLKTIAEGVETQEQLDFLRALQCDEIQGYLLSQPVSAEELTKQLQKKDLYRLASLGMNDEVDLSIRAQAARNVGYALADERLTILTSNPGFNYWAAGRGDDLVGRPLPEVLPELVGVEDTLRQLIHKQDGTYNIPKIYRPSEDGFGRYFDLQVEPFLASEAILLVMVTDVTDQAHLEFELRQERNELRLNLYQAQASGRGTAKGAPSVGKTG
jgi:EAL domain-containing protein (putative c-di-GMP-specific phosphodiesterase class I)